MSGECGSWSGARVSDVGSRADVGAPKDSLRRAGWVSVAVLGCGPSPLVLSQLMQAPPGQALAQAGAAGEIGGVHRWLAQSALGLQGGGDALHRPCGKRL